MLCATMVADADEDRLEMIPWYIFMNILIDFFGIDAFSLVQQAAGIFKRQRQKAAPKWLGQVVHRNFRVIHRGPDKAG